MTITMPKSYPSSSARAKAAKPAEPGEQYRVHIMLAVNAFAILLFAYAWLTGASLSPLTWYITRSSGLALYLLLWISMVFGLGVTTGLFDRFPGRAIVLLIHRFSTELAYSVLALHLFALILDTYVHYTLADILVPFHADGGDLWIGMGVIAAWATVLIGVSFSVRAVIGQRTWVILHMGSFPLYVLALFHGIGSGTDTGTPAVFYGYLASLGVVFFLTSYRILRGKERGNARKAAKPEQIYVRRTVAGDARPPY